MPLVTRGQLVPRRKGRRLVGALILALGAQSALAELLQSAGCPGPGCLEVLINTFDAGGGLSCDVAGCIAPGLSIEGTIGQVDAHPSMLTVSPPGNQFELFGGFWYAQEALQVPVSIAQVHSTRSGGQLELHFATSSNVGTVAFEILGANQRRLVGHPQLSSLGDSLLGQHYQLRLALDDAEFWIRAMDLDGSSVIHGPYSVGVGYGSNPDSDQQPIDWAPIMTSHEDRRRSADRAILRASTQPRVGLGVNETGLQRLRYEDLIVAGANAFAQISLTELALLERLPGQAPRPVALHLRSLDALFGPGDELLFLGRAADSSYTRESVYELTVDVDAARRMSILHNGVPSATTGSLRQSITHAPNTGYQFSSPLDDPFYARRLVATASPLSHLITVPADGLSGISGSVQLELSLYGGTDYASSIPDHHVQLKWNGVTLADQRFDGLSALTLLVDLSVAQLFASNAMEVVLPVDAGFPADVLLIESWTLRYARELLATAGALNFVVEQAQDGCRESLFGDGFEAPAAPAGGSCLGYATSALSADVVIVLEHDGDLAMVSGAASAAPTIAVNHAAGTHFWIADPSALKTPRVSALAATEGLLSGPGEYLIITHPAFLADLPPLVSAKQAQGLSVKLVDVLSIYEKYSAGRPEPEAIRAYLQQAVAPLATRFVALVGGSTFDPLNHLGTGAVDFLPTLYLPYSNLLRFGPADPALVDLDQDGRPDLPIGRFPVKTSAELALMLDKQLRYQWQGPSYGRRAVLLNDADPAHAFSSASAGFAAALGAEWTTTTIDRDQLGVAATRAALVAQVNSGASVVQYLGHSAPTRWGTQSLLSSADLAANVFDNAMTPPVVLQWGCWNSYFVAPNYSSIGGAWMSQANGAAAVIGASVLTETNHDIALANALLSRLNDPTLGLGEALHEAKQRFPAEQIDSQYGILLFGDPALRVH